jgi:peptidyl-tRNA hydrolase, PTH2 family
MQPGKIASQAGHAYIGAFLSANPILQSEYHQEFPEHPGTKICLKCDSLGQLLLAENAAKEAGIPYFKVTDSGCKNFFDGQPTITALGLGPATRDQIKHITGRFKLL